MCPMMKLIVQTRVWDENEPLFSAKSKKQHLALVLMIYQWFQLFYWGLSLVEVEMNPTFQSSTEFHWLTLTRRQHQHGRTWTSSLQPKCIKQGPAYRGAAAAVCLFTGISTATLQNLQPGASPVFFWIPAAALRTLLVLTCTLHFRSTALCSFP